MMLSQGSCIILQMAALVLDVVCFILIHKKKAYVLPSDVVHLMEPN